MFPFFFDELTSYQYRWFIIGKEIEIISHKTEVMMIHFNVPPVYGTEEEKIHEVIGLRKICGDGEFTKKCNRWIESNTECSKALLTTSCTHALEMAALLCRIQPGDEIIMPSYTFVSTANAFVLRGAKIVFVDIRPDTMNLDENLIESAITEETKAIVPVHYAGVSCEMDKILDIAHKYNLYVVEDAAQGVKASYKGRSLGAIGDFGCFSFHETKNYSMGEGGALLINDEKYTDEAEIIREKGTNRSQFWRGKVDKYRWVDMGSSYLPSELNAAYLYAQLENSDVIFDDRMESWNRYYNGLSGLASDGVIGIPTVPEGCAHNAHMFYIKVKDIEERTELIRFLKTKEIETVFHYVPLHSAPAGLKWGRFHGDDVYTTKESERLLRLPMYYKLHPEDVAAVINGIKNFYAAKK